MVAPSVLEGLKRRVDEARIAGIELAELTVTGPQVPMLVDEIYEASNPNVGLGRLPREETRRQLLAGRIKCFGLSVRVVSVKRRKSQNG